MRDWATVGTDEDMPAEAPTFTYPTGVYDPPIAVALWTPTDGATIRYTIDGSEPDEVDGLLYWQAIEVSTATTIRARAFKEGHPPSPIVSATYLFSPGIEAWRLQHFGTIEDEGMAADDFVVAGDGVPNLMKFALGQDPFVPATPSAVTDRDSGGRLRLTVTRDPLATGVTFSLVGNDDPADSEGWSTEGVVIDIDTPATLRGYYNAPLGAGRGFLRLRVERP